MHNRYITRILLSVDSIYWRHLPFNIFSDLIKVAISPTFTTRMTGIVVITNFLYIRLIYERTGNLEKTIFAIHPCHESGISEMKVSTLNWGVKTWTQLQSQSLKS
jgi:hypothetical protein